MRQNLGLGTFRLGLLFGLAGCSQSLSPALEALHDGRLPEAAAELRRLEPQFCAAPARTQARYALYRGVTELGLGNAVVAAHWLGLAWRADARDPHCFDAREHGELMAAWRSLGRLPGEPGS